MKWEDAIVEIKRRSDIVSVVGRFVKLKRSGHNWTGLCPFHQEKSPSFSVNPQNGFFKCFGCGAGGDLFSFLERQTGKLFPDLVREMAMEHQIVLDEGEKQSNHQQKTKQLKDFKAILLCAQRYFVNNLKSSEHALNYLSKERVLTKELIETFGLGYAGEEERSFGAYLQKNGISIDDALSLGLMRQGQYGAYPFYHGRITIPIYDHRGDIVGFGGRVFGEDAKSPKKPKYVNSAASIIYDKSSVLYGLDRALPLLRRAFPAVVCEGYFDVMAITQVAYPGLAPCGTSLSEEQIKTLSRYTKKVILCLDEDSAGQEASKRALLLFLKQGFEVRIAHLQSKDPDELTRSGQGELLKAALEGASDALEAMVLSLAKECSKGIFAKMAALDQLLPYLAVIERPLLREQYIRLVAQIFLEDEARIKQELRRHTPSIDMRSSSPQKLKSTVILLPKDHLILRVLLAQPAAFLQCSEELLASFHPMVASLCQSICDKVNFEGLSVEDALSESVVSPDPTVVALIADSKRHQKSISLKDAQDLLHSLEKARILSMARQDLGDVHAKLLTLSKDSDEKTLEMALKKQSEGIRAVRLLQQKKTKEKSPVIPKMPHSEPLTMRQNIEKDREEDEGWY